MRKKTRGDGPSSRSRWLADDGVLRLVDIREDHEAAFRSLRKRSGRFLSRWEPSRSPGDVPGSLVEFQRFLKASRGRRSRRLLCERIQDGRLVGQVAISMIEPGSLSNAVLGYWIGRPFIRRGYGTRMVGLALACTFDKIDIDRIEANIQPDNDASRHLLRGIGFRMEGYSPEYLEIDGKRRDHERWAILRSEWARDPSR